MGKRESNILIWIITPIFFSLWFYILLNKEKEVNVITKDPCDEFANNVWIVANTQSRVFAILRAKTVDGIYIPFSIALILFLETSAAIDNSC